MKSDPCLHCIVAAQPYPLLFATISGAHLYGFPSPDSDYDLRGAHVQGLPNYARGLNMPPRWGLAGVVGAGFLETCRSYGAWGGLCLARQRG
jgi:hypothetical protein